MQLAEALEGAVGVAIELAAFAVLVAAALGAQSWPGWWGLAGICVYSYIAVYCVSRVLMAYARKAVLAGVWFELHRLLGAACVLYALAGWYKLVFLAGRPPTSEPAGRLDAVLRGIAAISALWNYASGILFLPHVNLQAPLLLRQVFTIGTSMGLATYLLLVIVQMRAWWPRGNGLVTAVSVIAVVWNVVAVTMGIRAAQLLAREKPLDEKDLRERKPTGDKPNTSVASFFVDIFVTPDKYAESAAAREGLKQLRQATSKRCSQVVLITTSSAPGIVMGIMALNLGTNSTLPVLGPDALHSDWGAAFTLTVTEIMAFSVIPANMLDLTFVLRQRMTPMRAALEVPMSFLGTCFGPLMLAAPCLLPCLPPEEAALLFAYLRGIVWPLFAWWPQTAA